MVTPSLPREMHCGNTSMTTTTSLGEVISGSTPPGFSIVNKHLVPNGDADAVRQVFDHYARTGNLHETMRFASTFGIFPSTSAAFKKLLQNPSYIGSKRGNNHFCEGIVDQALFVEIQSKLQRNIRSSQKRVYIFSGLIRCKECGNVMAGLQQHLSSRDKKAISCYRCAKRYSS